MSTLTRKQREVHQRELMLLDVARKMLVENGYAGLNMDRLAEATEYSEKGRSTSTSRPRKTW